MLCETEYMYHFILSLLGKVYTPGGSPHEQFTILTVW